jgi:hypothetical protein
MNQAYDQLVEAASGEVVLFCGVDVRFDADSIRLLVEQLLQERLKMLSVVPVNIEKPSLIQPMRYVWEIAVPRSAGKRPPVLSSCWLAERAALLQVGGFDAVQRQIVPEAHFAHLFGGQNTYRFITAKPHIGITTAKSLEEQRATAVRTRYPQLHRRPELVLLPSLMELLILLTPLVLAGVGVISKHYVLLAVGLVLVALAATTYAKVLAAAYPKVSLKQLVALPLALLLDIGLLNFSMWKYEFSEVEWKGRNVCVSVMHVYPRLPQLEKAQPSNSA